MRWLTLLLVVIGALSASCSRRPDQTISESHVPATQVDVPGLHNVFRLTDHLYSGSSPDDDDGFQSLQTLGVKTIISVDGARPDIERAQRFGCRYVHIPIGYDGIPEPQALRIARAVRDLPGPVYLHCHHGKHRGPAAAAVARLCLDDSCSTGNLVEWMRRAGTDPHYVGLYAAIETMRRPSAADLDRVPAEFPAVATVSDLAQAMVAIDKHWEHLKQAKAADWTTPPHHPDLAPAHLALQIVEQYREASRWTAGARSADDLRQRLLAAEQGARDLEQLLRSHPENREQVDRAYRRAAATCTGCHEHHRDVPQVPSS
jgi:protein tyrosine phosphatase (PTP) superfamily phosphohydrolase (DUF442 family)